MINCKHRRIKRNYPFGKHSKATMYCKDCGKIIKGKDLFENKRERKKQKI